MFSLSPGEENALSSLHSFHAPDTKLGLGPVSDSFVQLTSVMRGSFVPSVAIFYQDVRQKDHS